jgi:hypothetical protein
MIAIFGDFCKFSAKKLAFFFSKTNVMIKFLHYLALFWVENANFLPIFWWKYLKNHNIGPRSGAADEWIIILSSCCHSLKALGNYSLCEFAFWKAGTSWMWRRWYLVCDAVDILNAMPSISWMWRRRYLECDAVREAGLTRSQPYDFGIYNYSASVVVGYVGRLS